MLIYFIFSKSLRNNLVLNTCTSTLLIRFIEIKIEKIN